MNASELRAIRYELRLTQAQLAVALDVSRDLVSMMELGKHPIRRVTEFAVLYLRDQPALRRLAAQPLRLGSKTAMVQVV
jgi:transcriptional regulator with XRE-family HTH domain